MFGRSKRLTALVLTLVMLFSAVQPGTFALQVQTAEAGTLTLPASLTEIEDEAFAGIGVLSGLVTLPSGVTRVGARAFKDSGVYALDVPAGVQTVEGQEDELAYLYVRGSSTLLTSASGACFVFAPAGSNAQQTAQAQGVTFVDASTLAVQDGFYYQVADGAATLLCAVEDTAVPAQVTIPETVGGVPVTALSAHAFFGCGQVTQVNVPAGVTAAEGAFSGCPNAEVVYASAELQVLSVTADLTEITAGDTVTWTAAASGGTAPYKYQFAVYLGDTRLVQSSYTTENTYAYTFTEAGDYHIIVRVRDDDYTVVEYMGEADSNTFTAVVDAAGTYTLSVQVLDADNNSVSLTSEALTVTLAPLTADSLTASADAIQTEDTVTWTATASGGLAPYTYAFVLTSGETVVAEQPAGESASFAYTFLAAGDYVLTVTDATITWTALAIGGDRVYTYAFSLYKDGEEVDFRAFSQDNTFAYVPAEVGSYHVEVTVRDGEKRTATAASEPVTVTLCPLSIQEVTLSETIIELGGSITIDTVAVGGLVPLKYSYEIYLDGVMLTATAYSLTSAYTYTPAESGEYTFTACVRDGETTTVSKTSAAVTVYDTLTLNSLTAAPDAVQSGEAVTWTADVTGGKGVITYDWYVYYNDELEYTTRTTAPTLTYAPMRAGDYTVRVDAADQGDDTATITGGAVAVSLHASTPAEDFTYTYQNGTYCTITGYTGTDTALVLPGESPDGHIVQVVADSAFKGNTTLTSVVFADSIETMGSSVFQNCTSLLAFTGGKNLTNIGAYAFQGCTKLPTFTGSDGLTTIGADAFSDCTGLTSVSLPDGLTTIWQYAFYNCTSLQSIRLPDSITTLYENMFYGCAKLSSVNYPISWTTKARSDSYYSSTLQSPFYDCASLKSIVVPEGVTAIPSYAFNNCTSLTSITIPATVESIGTYAFYNCTNLAIYGVSGSYVETYAAENNISFNPAPAPEVTLDVSASGSTAGASLVATASAANGSGGYTFCYMLYQDGTLVRQTEYVSATTHTFPIYEAGSYQVVVCAKDRVGMIGTAYGGMIEFSDAECTTISGRVLDDMGNPVQGATVSIAQDTSAATMVLISRSVDLAAAVLTDADGQWSWDQAIPGATYTISAAKDGLTFETIISALIDSIWGIVVEPLYALGLGYAPVASGCSLTGTITAADGTPVQGVSVVITTADGTRVANTTTGEDGSWGVMGLSADVAYTVTYGENQTTVEPAAETVTLASGTSTSLTAVAELITGVASDRVTFTMSAETIIVGYAATFTVTVPEEATKVRLVVDGSNYDVLYPENGTCTYTRTFTKSGERQVAFQIAVDGVWADISATQTLNIISDGTLDAPVYADITTHYTGTDLTIDWEDVDKAQAYNVWLYYEQVPVNCFETQESAVTIPGNEFPQAGAYGVSVMATGGGYDQSAADDLFTVVLRDYAFEMVTPKDGYPYVVGDQVDMTLTQSGGGYLTVKVTEPSGRTTWYPQTETGLTGEESAWLPFTVTEAGVHTLTPYLYTVSELTDTSTPLYVGKAVEIIVSGPNVRSIKPAGGNYTWVYANESTLVRVTTNNAAESVELYEGDALLASTDVYTEENYIRTFDLTLSSALSKGKHTLTAVAKDADSEASSSKPYSFYVVESVSGGSEVYPQAETLNLYSSPINGSLLATVNGGANIDKLTIIGDAGDWYMLRTADDVKAFAAYEQVSGEAWEGATGSIVITCPPEGVSLPIDPNKYLQFAWNTGLVVPDGATYTITVDALVGDTCITEEADVCEALIAMKRMPADEYTVTVSLVSGGETLATSAPVTFTMGDFSLEDSYKAWWLENIAPWYAVYLEEGTPFSGEVSVWYGWAGFIDTEINAAHRPKKIFEAATLAYTQILQDYKDLKKDSTTNAENNYALVIIDQAAIRRTMLLNISASMLNETEKGNLKLNEQMDNIDTTAQSNQTIAMRDASADALFAGLDVVTKGISVGMKAYAASKGGTMNETAEEVLDAVEEVVDVLEETVTTMFEGVAVGELLSAYADEYVGYMKGACDAYVDCLETTYKDNDWSIPGTYSSYVQEYINVFRQIRNESNNVGDPSQLYDAAIDQILAGTGYTAKDIDNMQQNVQGKYAATLSLDLLIELIVGLMNDTVNDYLEETYGEDAVLDDGFFVYNTATNELEINDEALVEKLGDAIAEEILKAVGERLIREEYKTYMRQNIQDALNEKIELPDNHVSIAETFMKGEIKEWKGICGTVLEMAHDSWDLGIALSELGTAANVIYEQANNKGVFDTYGLRLISTLKLRLDAQIAAGLIDYDWDSENMDNFSVERLDSYCQGLVTLANYDINIMTNYRNMRVINDNNGNKFDYDLDWLSVDTIDARIDLIELYRDKFLSRPPVYDELFE